MESIDSFKTTLMGRGNLSRLPRRTRAHFLERNKECNSSEPLSSNFWLGNLAVANLAVSLFCIFPNLTVHLLDEWIYFGELMCKMYHFITSLWQGVSILIHLLISFERWVFLLHPIRYKQIFTKQKLLLKTSAAVWLASAPIGLPSLCSFGLGLIQLNEKGDVGKICVPITSIFTSAQADTISFLLIYFIPLVLVVAMYLQIGFFLRESGKLRMELDEQSTSAERNQFSATQLLTCQLQLGGKSTAVESRPIRKVRSAPEDVWSIPMQSHVPSSGVAFTIGDQYLPSKAMNNIPAESAKGSRKWEEQHRDGLCFEPTTQPTESLENTTRPGCSTDRGMSRSDCVFRQVLSGQEMLSKDTGGTLEMRRRYGGKGRMKSTHGSHSPTACSAFSPDEQERTTTAQTLEAPTKLYRVNRKQLSHIRCKQRQKSILMLILLVLAFAFLNFPHHTLKIWLNLTSLNGSSDVAKLLFAPYTFALMFANCAVSPIIYYAFMSKYFRACWNDL